MTKLGTSGADTINAGTGGDTVVGFEGNDLITGNTGADWLLGNQGDDTVYGGDGLNTVVGGQGNDLLFGGADADFMYGNEANDTINAGNGNDSVIGGKGDDVLSGADGNDLIFGNEGNDSIFGGAGDDTAGFSGARSNFTITAVAGGYQSVDNTGVEGTDFISSDVEHLLFGDGTNVSPADLVDTTTTVNVPTAEAHEVVHASHVQAPAAFLNSDGTLPFSHGAPSNDMNQVVDNTSGFQFYTNVHDRQLTTDYQPTSITQDSNGVVHEDFTVPGGTQNNSAGVRADRSEISIDFLVGGSPNFLLDPSYHLQWSSSANGFTADGHVTVAADGTQAFIVDHSSNPALVAANVIGDDPHSTTYATNSVNMAFAEFGGNPNFHGVASFEIDLVRDTGLGAGQVVAGLQTNLHAA